jgi:hypothetical protein
LLGPRAVPCRRVKAEQRVAGDTLVRARPEVVPAKARMRAGIGRQVFPAAPEELLPALQVQPLAMTTLVPPLQSCAMQFPWYM